jgi:hypothetical protein
MSRWKEGGRRLKAFNKLWLCAIDAAKVASGTKARLRYS